MTPKHSKNIYHAIDKEAEEWVNFMIQDIPTDSQSPLASKNKVRQELLEKLGAEEYRKRIPLAQKALYDDLKGHLTPIQLKDLEKELEQGLEKILSLSEQHAASFQEMLDKVDAMPNSFQELLGFSDQTIEYFYQSGMRYYESRRYQEAAHIFFFLTVLNPFRFNVWIALGLAEKQAHHDEKALQAFAMATLVNTTSIIPQIHSIECYLNLKDDQNAKQAFAFALQTLEEHPTEENNSLQAYLHQIGSKLQ